MDKEKLSPEEIKGLKLVVEAIRRFSHDHKEGESE